MMISPVVGLRRQQEHRMSTTWWLPFLPIYATHHEGSMNKGALNQKKLKKIMPDRFAGNTAAEP